MRMLREIRVDELSIFRFYFFYPPFPMRFFCSRNKGSSNDCWEKYWFNLCRITRLSSRIFFKILYIIGDILNFLILNAF